MNREGFDRNEWPDRWFGTKVGAAAGCIGALVHTAKSFGLISGELAVPLQYAIPAELLITTMAGLIVDLLRPIRSRLHATIVGMLAALPAMTLGAFLFGGTFDRADLVVTVLGGSVLVGGLFGAIVYFRIDEL